VCVRQHDCTGYCFGQLVCQLVASLVHIANSVMLQRNDDLSDESRRQGVVPFNARSHSSRPVAQFTAVHMNLMYRMQLNRHQ
jgi:hypothetical protein